MDFGWLEKFTALVQLISAINFAHIFTHFVEKISKIIFNEEVLVNYNFIKYKEGTLVKLKHDIDKMSPIQINGKSTKHIESLQKDVKLLIKQWDKVKIKSRILIKRIKKVKGLKCLFLYISAFCIIDMLNMAIINVCNNHFILIFVYLLNIFSLIISLLLVYKIIFFKWGKKDDFACYNQTWKYLVYTIVLSLFLAFFNELYVRKYGILFDISPSISSFSLLLCVILPLIPCFFSIVLLLSTILILTIYRLITKFYISVKIFIIIRKKKYLEKTVYTLMGGTKWE